MNSKTQQGSNLLEELNLLSQPHPQQPLQDESVVLGNRFKAMLTHLPLEKKAMKEDSPDCGKQRRVFCFQKWKGLRTLADIKRRQPRCLVCLQVHQIRDFPVSMNGQALTVGWRTKGWEGEETMPVHAYEGIASFDEIFLHYCRMKSPCSLKSFDVWVSSVDSKECDLGTFQVDLSEMASIGNSNSKFGGKTMSFILCGIAEGSTLTVSFYYTIIAAESPEFQHLRCDSTGQKQSKSKCFSCFPDLKCCRNRSLASSTRGVSSRGSDIGFITIENSTGTRFCVDNDEEGFITIEKEPVRTRSRRPPSDNSLSFGSEEGKDEGFGKDKVFLIASSYEESEISQVEDEFLKMLDEKQGKTGECEMSDALIPWEKELVNLNLKLDLGFDLDLDWELDSMMKVAEKELLKATQVWKSRVGARALENAEYEELKKRWKSNEITCQSSSALETFGGFGSPI